MYKELTKEARKKLRNKYEITKKGKDLSGTLNRLLFEGMFLVFCFIIILIAILIADLSWWYLVVALLALIFGIVFLIGQHIIRMKEYNKFFKQLSKNEKNQLTKCK